MTRQRVLTRKTPIPEPTVHATEPYTRQRWRLNVSFLFRLYRKFCKRHWSDAAREFTWDVALASPGLPAGPFVDDEAFS